MAMVMLALKREESCNEAIFGASQSLVVNLEANGAVFIDKADYST